VPFTNLPFLLDAGAACGENFVNPGSAGTYDGFSIVGGHEYAESVTDPVPDSGWIDTADSISGGEVADKCAWGGESWGGSDPIGDVTIGSSSYAMQSLWSNAAGQCVLAATEDTVTVTSPGAQSTVTGDSVSLHVTGSSSGGHPLEWHATGLPPGLSINPSTGLISGTPTTTGSYTADVFASNDTGGSNSASFTWTVNADTVSVSSPGNQTGYAHAAVSLQLAGTSSGGFTPLTWSATGLPAGLKLNAATGLITGAPTTAGASSVTVTATDTKNTSGSASFTWTVQADAGKAVKESSAAVCLNDRNSIAAGGNPVTVAKCNGSGAQKWTFPAPGELTVFGLCLADYSGGGSGTKLSLEACRGDGNEVWSHKSNDEYVLSLNHLCLTDPNNSTKNGTQVTVTTCHDTNSQKWTKP
jgi:Ricin-type beta-trefoil lectin domain/Putative Ig domain